MSRSPLAQAPSRGAALSDVMLESAGMVQAVRAGRSLSESLLRSPLALRAATQAVSFHVMRRLALACALRDALARRPPADPRFDALVLVALSLLDTALEHQALGDGAVSRRDLPLYKPHTVVDQAVRAAASERGMKGARGFLNAILRRYVNERADILKRVSGSEEVVWNHPQWWVNRLRQAYPLAWQGLLEAANQPGPLTLRVNARRAAREQVMAAFAEAGIGAEALDENAIVVSSPRPVRELPGFDAGWWSVQDASAQLAGRLLDPGPGMRVLDACAAPGGKTAHLLERADIELLALDSDAGRLERVHENLERLGLLGEQVRLRQADAAQVSTWWDGRPFDAILADVPCTASGVVRRHPDIRWLRRESDIAPTAALQATIVDALWTTLKPGGRLLYASCSLFPEEGQHQAESFLERHPDAHRRPAPGQILTAPAGGQPGGARYDGFFYALFEKRT